MFAIIRLHTNGMSSMERQTFCTRAAVLRGVEALPVVVEVSVSKGMPGVTIVGMPDAAVMEARHRVRCACKACGFEWPRAHLTINLAPSELRKSGTGFDLPIAVAILVCTGQIPHTDLDDCLFVGELGLNGEVCGIRGLVAYSMLAEDQGLTLVAPNGALSTRSGEARVISHLSQMRGGIRELPRMTENDDAAPGFAADAVRKADFADVVDQDMAKRAFVISAAGNHGLLMVGPPGAGKSMMAKCMPTIMPPLDETEKAEALLIHSVAGQEMDDIRRGIRPFRAPHHAISKGGLIGGGHPVRPGEVSLAHHGVLFLDELPEFGPSVLQALRQPLEEHEVRLVRVEGTYVFPSNFMLVAAANPCPCGYLGDPDHECQCSASRIQAYQSRIGGPLMDRIDVLVDVARPSSARIIAGEKGVSSEQMARQVAMAREYASWRRARQEDEEAGDVTGIPRLHLDAQASTTLEGMAHRLGLGGRNITRIARVARTIADLAQSSEVRKDHVMEACAYRTRTTL